MKNKNWLAKDTFNYRDNNFIDNDTSRNKLKKIEKIKTDLSLSEKDEYMTLYAAHEGVIILKHNSKESAFSAVNSNEAYYRQLWIYDEEKGAYKYVAEYEKGKKIIF